MDRFCGSTPAVPDSEFERYFNTYFVAPGDDEKTIKLKQQARQTAADAIKSIMPRQPAEPAGFDVKTLTDEQLMQMIGQ